MCDEKVKIQIGNRTWIFDDTVKVEMLQADPHGDGCAPYRFCLNVETFQLPTVYEKVQDGNVTEYIKLA